MTTQHQQNARIRCVNSKPCWGKENQLFTHIKTARTKIVKVNDRVKIPIKQEELNFAIPGLKHVIDSKKGIVFNILWLIIVSGSFSLCCYQIYDRFHFFLSYPIDTRITILRNESVKFPSLTVCAPPRMHVPIIPILQSIAKKRNVPICSLHPVDLLSELNFSSMWRMMSTEGLTNYVGTISRSSFVSLKMRDDVSNVSLLTTYGNCTTFSIKELVPFQAEDYAMYIGFNSLPKEIACLSSGPMLALYFVHLDDEDVTYKFSRGYALSLPQKSEVIGLKAKQFKIINRTESPCDSTAVVSQCEKKCFEDHIKNYIPCGLPFMSPGIKPRCENETNAYSMLLNIYELLTAFRYAKNCSCPNRCNEIMYSKNLKQLAETGWSSLQYFFEDDVVEDVEEYYSYTAIPFICDVGGNLGLFLGLCIPNIIDSIQSVIVFLYMKVTLKIN